MTVSGASRNGDSSDRDTLLLAGGVALIVFGAGLILSNRTIRRYLGQVEPSSLIEAALPDLQRYLALRSM